MLLPTVPPPLQLGLPQLGEHPCQANKLHIDSDIDVDIDIDIDIDVDFDIDIDNDIDIDVDFERNLFIVKEPGSLSLQFCQL